MTSANSFFIIRFKERELLYERLTHGEAILRAVDKRSDLGLLISASVPKKITTLNIEHADFYRAVSPLEVIAYLS